jgi:segregation and condensation protein B
VIEAPVETNEAQADELAPTGEPPSDARSANAQEASDTPEAADKPDEEREPEGSSADEGEPLEGDPAGDDLPADELPALIEALLFVSDGPVEEAMLARALEASRRSVRKALDALGDALHGPGRGIRLQRGPQGAQLVTAVDAAEHVEHFLGLEGSRRLSTAALETLAIVAYRQPMTRALVETIRGVNSDGAIATLRARGLISDAGRAPGPGRPVLFVTTQRFLEHFGLEQADDLPPLPDDVAEHERQATLEIAVARDGESDPNEPDDLQRLSAAAAAALSQSHDDGAVATIDETDESDTAEPDGEPYGSDAP